VVGGSPDSPAARLVREAGRGIALGRDRELIRTAIQKLVAGKKCATTPNQAFIAKLSREEQARRFLEILAGGRAKD